MWSSGFSSSLVIEPLPTGRGYWLAGAAALLAVAALWISRLPPAWAAGLAVLLVAEVLRLVLALRRIPACLVLGPDGSCRAGSGGDLRPMVFRPAWTCPSVAVGIRLEAAGQRPLGCLLFRHQLEPTAWRRLLVRCRQPRPGGMT